MDISKILEEPLLFGPDDSVSRVASSLLKQRRHEALIVKDGVFQGIVLASDVVKRNVQNPEKTRIGSFAQSIELAFPETSVQDATNEILINNFKSLPVESFVGETRKLSVVTKTGLIKLLVNEPVIKNRVAEEIMNFPYCVDKNDSISTAKSIIRDMEVSIIPVVDENDNVLGVIETVDLLRASTQSMEKMGRGDLSGEKKSLKEVLATSVMQTNFQKASPDTPLKDVANLLLSARIHVVIIEENGKLIGMITPRDILKMFGAVTEGVYVTVNGISEEDDFIKSWIDDEVRNHVKKINKIVPVQYFVINVRKYRENGKRTKYSVRSRIMTQKGPYFSHDFNWDITKAFGGMLLKLEKELIRDKDKKNVYSRSP